MLLNHVTYYPFLLSRDKYFQLNANAQVPSFNLQRLVLRKSHCFFLNVLAVFLQLLCLTFLI